MSSYVDGKMPKSRLDFTNDGVGVGVVIRGVGLYDLVKKSVLFPITTPSFTIKRKLGCRGRKEKRKN